MSAATHTLTVIQYDFHEIDPAASFSFNAVAATICSAQIKILFSGFIVVKILIYSSSLEIHEHHLH